MNASVLRSIKSFWMAVVTMAAAYTIAAAPPEARASESAQKAPSAGLSFAAGRAAEPAAPGQLFAIREPATGGRVDPALAHAPQALSADLGNVVSVVGLREIQHPVRQRSDDSQDLKLYPVLLALIGVMAMLASRRSMGP